MTRVIRIDDDVESELKKLAVVHDLIFCSPNEVLRRVLALDGGTNKGTKSAPKSEPYDSALEAGDHQRWTGRKPAREWGVDVQHALYRESGDWYHDLQQFPGAYLDATGYVVFNSREEYRQCPQLERGKTVHVPGGISAIPGYICQTVESGTRGNHPATDANS
jgi:hypothetical protein